MLNISNRVNQLGVETRRRTQGLVAINISAIIFGTAALFGKIDVSPVWIVDLRATFAALVLLAFAIGRRQLRRPPVALVPSLLGTGVILAVHWITFFMAVQLAGIATATLTFATFPLFTVVINGANERMRPRFLEVVAGCVIVAAVSLLVNVELVGSDQRLGVAAGLASAISFAVFTILSKTLGRALSPLLISVYQNGVVAVVLVPFLPFAGHTPDRGSQWFWLVVLGVTTTALMHQLYFFALQRLSPTTCSGFVALEPVYAIIFASMFFNEPLTISVVIAGAMILAASFMLLLLDRAMVAPQIV